MAAGTAVSAKNAKVRIGSGPTTLYAAEWDAEDTTNWADTTNFESAGFTTQVACIAQGKVNVSGFLDGGQDMFANPPNINAGQNITTLKLYLNGTGAGFYSFPLLSVTSAKVTANVKDDLKYTFSGISNGTYSVPTGNF